MADNFLDAKTGDPVVTYNTGVFQTVPTYTAFTNAAQTSPGWNVVKYKPEGDHARIRAIWGGGTAVSSTTNNVTFNLPSGMTMDMNGFPLAIPSGASLSTRQPLVGVAYVYMSSTNSTLVLMAVATSATTVQFRRENNVTLRENILASNDEIEIDILVPIVGWSVQTVVGAGIATLAKPGLLFQSPQINIASQVTGTYVSFAVARAVAIVTMDGNGVYRCKFNINVTFAAPSPTISSYGITISGLVTKNVSNYFQAVTGIFSNFINPTRAYMGVNAGNIVIDTATAIGATGLMISGDVELESKPTWA